MVLLWCYLKRAIRWPLHRLCGGRRFLARRAYLVRGKQMSFANLAAAALAFGRDVDKQKPNVKISELPYRKVTCGNVEIRTGGDYPGKDRYVIACEYGSMSIHKKDLVDMMTALFCITT